LRKILCHSYLDFEAPATKERKEQGRKEILDKRTTIQE
jgi:hypothetical protein